MSDSNGYIRVATVTELETAGCLVVAGVDRPIAVFWADGNPRAVDNRCPHMGFPMHQGTVSDGIVTCHWHHARFELSSGCTFDLFADDLPTCEVKIEDNVVYVARQVRQADEVGRAKRRLNEGMAQNIGLIIAKSVISLLRAATPTAELVCEGALFGSRYRDGWGPGMTILTALANLAPSLDDESRFLALYQGLRRVAGDCAGQIPRRDRYPLEGAEADLPTLKRWFRYWTLVRHRDAAERTLLTALANGAGPRQTADLLFCAITDRFYANTGHALDFSNKAFEVLDLIGWEHAPEVLPTVVQQVVSARGGEELNAWRHPVDLVPLLEAAFAQLPAALDRGRDKLWSNPAGLAQNLLGDDPHAVVGALVEAIQEGARPRQLSQALCYAAALRLARFGQSNEQGDWITALHTFTYCQALHQALKRLDAEALPEVLRGVFHGAMSVYLDRFLNVPPAPLPTARELVDEPTDADELRARLLQVLDTREQVDAAARVTARYLSLGHPLTPLVETLARAVLREDAEFHTFQVLEAGVQQAEEWGEGPESQAILIAVARYLGAHSPTQRTQLQTAEIALRLHRGDALYEGA